MTAPAPTAPAGIQRLGPGSLMLGQTGSLRSASSLINGCVLEPSSETSDSTTKLSGWVRGGTTRTTWALSGNIDTDAANASGIWALAFEQAGETIDFVFVPEDESEVEVSGELTITPLSLGADEFGADLTSDFEWTIIGTPTVTR